MSRSSESAAHAAEVGMEDAADAERAAQGLKRISLIAMSSRNLVPPPTPEGSWAPRISVAQVLQDGQLTRPNHVTLLKLLKDAEQFRYFASLPLPPPQPECMRGHFASQADAWRHLAREYETLARHITTDAMAQLTSDAVIASDFHIDSPIPPPPPPTEGNGDPYHNLRQTYGKVLVMHDAPATPESPLGAGWWAHQQTMRGQRSESPDEAMAGSGVAVIDRCVSPSALSSLRTFLTHSTVWQSSLAGGYLGAYQQHGFTPAVLLQLGAAVKRMMPATLGPHRIQRMWSYKYANFGNGTGTLVDEAAGGFGTNVLSYNEGKGPMISAHSDPSTITINLWTAPWPEKRRQRGDVDGGGLVIYPLKLPDSVQTQSTSPELSEAASQRIKEVYGERKNSSSPSHPAPRKIPYQHNRCVVFDSRLLHETVPVQFEPGFGQERISVTILYGDPYGIPTRARKGRL